MTITDERKYTTPARLIPLGYQQISTLTSAVGLTPPPRARIAYVQPVGEAVRWRDDGTDPTAAIGMVIADGIERLYEGNLATVKFIEQAATAVLNVVYYE